MGSKYLILIHFHSYYFENYTPFRKLCYNEWKAGNPEAPDGDFEAHWKTLGHGEKLVSDAAFHILSYLTLLSCSEIQQPSQTRTSASSSIATIFDKAVLPQDSGNSGQGASA